MSHQSDSHTPEPTEHTSSRTPSTSVRFAGPHADHSQAAPSTTVNIDEAKEEFRRLERQLSRISQASKPKPSRIDLEKGTAGGEQGEAFDLREYLSSANDANARAGIKHKHVGVTWEDLEVSIFGGANQKIYAPTFGTAVVNFWTTPFTFVQSLYQSIFPSKGAGPTRSILHKSSGNLKPGEMCLVLGVPGSGCTTFLKAITNQRDGYADVSGEVLYAGISAEEMTRRYRGEVVFNHEDDLHFSTLTVAQTLEFALSTKTPAKRAEGLTKREFNSTVMQSLLKMLNISHTASTLVGDAFVRGVSGGEKKRVSIAEMMTTRARVQAWDGSTRGLDAATALDFIKCLRVMTDVLGQTTFVTLYQGGDQIYRLFDKVLILDQGRQVYFGSPSEARQYFVDLGYKDLPRQSTADYLTGCTDPHERQFAGGRSEKDVPHGPTGLQEAFRASEKYRELIADTDRYRTSFQTDVTDQEAFRQSVLDDKRRGVSKKSPFTLGYIGQVKALTRRQFQLRLQDRFSLYTSYLFSTVLALVIGVTFYNLPKTAAGGFTRGSVIFMAMLTSALEAFGELPTVMLGRPILNKQSNFSFYRPSAIAWANLIADLPFTALRVLIFDVIVFFMPHLARSAGSFWTFHFYNYFAFIVMQAFFRFLGLVCANFDSAFRIGAFFIPNMITYAGYVVPVSRVKKWLIWIYYINPLSYAWGALMENEFSRIDLDCDGNYIVPRNIPQAGVSGYPSGLGPNQACSLFGSTAGSSNIIGSDYIKIAFNLDAKDLWRRNLPVLFGMFVFFSVLQVYFLEFSPHKEGGTGSTLFARGTEKNEEPVDSEDKLEQEHGAPGNNDEKTKLKGESISTKVFTWEHLDYTVPVPGGSRRLLSDVFGYVRPGTLTALMGASGAGKTTCLDVLAQRKNIGIVSGDILIDGRPLAADFARGTAYAEQMDVHEGTATVREALRFSAYLRQPFSVPESEKDAYVEEIIDLLELHPLADALVLSLNTEARKRLTIGVELASKPQLLLRTDIRARRTVGMEPGAFPQETRRCWSGYPMHDTPTLSIVIREFRSFTFETGGKTVYHGPIGRDSEILRSYFSRNGATCPSDANPAEYMLEAIGAGVTPRIGLRDWHDIWLDSPEYQVLLQEIGDLKIQGLAKTEVDLSVNATYATPFYYQLKIVANRALTALWRSPDYIFTRLFVHVFISLFVSLSLLQLGKSLRDLQYRVFGIFWTTVMPAIVVAQIEPAFILNRMIFIREASSRIYSPYVFALGQLLSEIPYSVLCAILYWVLFVWPMGFGQGDEGIGGNFFQLLVVIFIELFGVSLGQVIAALSPSIRIAALFNPFVTLVLTTYAGVTIPFPTLAKFWRSWLYQLTPYTRVLSAMLSTELKGLEITCVDDEFTVFDPPSGQTCMEWAGAFMNAVGGYVDNPDDTSGCRYCQYRFGDQFFTSLNINFSNRWRDAFLILAYFAFNIAVTIVASRFLRYARR